MKASELVGNVDPELKLRWASNRYLAFNSGPFHIDVRMHDDQWPLNTTKIIDSKGGFVAGGDATDVARVFALLEFEYTKWLMLKPDGKIADYYTCRGCKQNFYDPVPAGSECPNCGRFL